MVFKFGIFDSFDRGVSEPGEVLRNRLDFAVRAEELGIDHYHVTEHHGTPLSVCPSPNIFLAALSQRTQTMRIGALVYVLPMYDPLRFAEEIATLDQICDGRLDLGVGRGVSPYELAHLGVDPDRSRDMYAEMLDAVRDALASGRMRHEGALLRTVDAQLSVVPVQRPHPPLWYASSNTSAAEWAGRNGVNFVGRWNGGTFAPAVETYRRAAPDTADGTGPMVGTQATVYIGKSDDEAYERYRKADEVFGRQLVHLWHEHDDHRVDAMSDSEGNLRRGNALVGSAATVREALLAQVELTGTDYFEALLWFGDLSREEALANLTAFAQEVAPAVRERARAQ